MYEKGLVLALFIWLFNAGRLIVNVNSQLERNLHRMGQRLSWVTVTPKPSSGEEWGHRTWFGKLCKFLFLALLRLIFAFTSWLYVLTALGGLAWALAKDAGAPAAVREFRGKMKNVDISFDHLV